MRLRKRNADRVVPSLGNGHDHAAATLEVGPTWEPASDTARRR